MKIQSLATGDRQAGKLSYIWGVATRQGSSELNTAMRFGVGARDTGPSGRTRTPSAPQCNPRYLPGGPVPPEVPSARPAPPAPVPASGRLTRVWALGAGEGARGREKARMRR